MHDGLTQAGAAPNRQRWGGLLALGALLSAPPASAAPGVTIDEAVSRALARAPELGAVRQAEAASRSRIAQASSAYLPRVGLEASYSVHWPKNELPIDLSGLSALTALNPNLKPPQVSDIDDYHRVRAGGGVSWRLLDVSRGPMVEAAVSSYRAEQARGRETAAALAFQVRATFLAALFARDLRQIAGESLTLAVAEERRASLRAEVGTGSQLAVAQARVRSAGLRAQLRQAESELDRQRRQLASLLGFEPSALPELRGELATLAGEERSASERGAAKRRELDQTPTLERLRRAQQAAELQARASDRGFWPTASVTARADYEYPHAFRLEWGPLLQGGVSLTWDLYDGGLRRLRTAEARASARGLADQTSAARESLGRRLIDVEARIRTARADLLSARETLEQHEVYLRVARASLAAGTGTELDVHNAELGHDRARVAVEQALLNQALARAEGLMIHGVSVEDSKPSGGWR